MGWSGGYTEWTDGRSAFLSVAFSWKLQHAFQRAAWFRGSGYTVYVGGPAVEFNRHFFNGAVHTDYPMPEVVHRHNPQATFTTRGCIRKCQYCIVPKLTPALTELSDWPVRPIVCDDNILAASRAHFDRVIDRLKPLRGVDFNQGIDARCLTWHHADRLAELDMPVVRLAWDSIEYEQDWMDAFETLVACGIRPGRIRSYVLIGFTDTQEDALYRLQTVKRLGARPIPMRYQPLNSLTRNAFVGPHWTEGALAHFQHYWFRQAWLHSVPFSEYERSGRSWSEFQRCVV